MSSFSVSRNFLNNEKRSLYDRDSFLDVADLSAMTFTHNTHLRLPRNGFILVKDKGECSQQKYKNVDSSLCIHSAFDYAATGVVDSVIK